MTQWWLWSYVVVMVGGALWFIRWSRDAKGIPQASYRVVIAILLWSASWHAVLALGGGQTEVAGHPVHWARYADWVVTVPLLVVALTLTATHAVRDKRRGVMVAMVAAGVPMVLCGMAADFMTSRAARFTFYGLGMLALLVLLGLIWGPLRATAMRQPRSMASLYKEVALLLSVLWASFPLVWILGPSGIGMFGDLADTALILVLSIVMKVGWSVVDLGRLRALSDRGELSTA